MGGNRNKPAGAAVAAIILSFGVLCLIAFGWPALGGGATDFRSFYAGARLAGTPDLYSIDHVHRIQREYSDPRELKAFTRPPFYALMLWPLGQVRYSLAHVLWQAMNLAALGGFLLLWSRSTTGVLLCCWFLPVWVSFMVAQDAPLILLFVSLSAYLLRKDRHWLAGLVFALCAAKFHLFLLLPLLIFGKRLWRFAAGLLAGGAVLAGVSFAVAGPEWPWRQLALLRLNEAGEASRSYMPNLNGLFHAVPYGKALLAVSTLAVICAAWYVIRRLPLPQAMAAMLCAGLLVGMHAFLYDCVFLLPFLLLFAEREGLEKTLPVWIAVGLSPIALGRPALSFVAQATVALLFCFIVYDTHRSTRRASAFREAI